MKYESVSQAVEELKKLQRVNVAYNHVLGVTHLDAATAAPKGSSAGRAQTMEILSEITYNLIADEKNSDLLNYLQSHDEIPAQWNRLYKEYLGIEVPDDTHGCLQDSHWSGGMFGYFPSYALGSAYGPQMVHVMEQELGSFDALIADGKIGKIKQWLRENIHRHAGFIKPGELFTSVCGKFDAKYYTDYLTKKYSELYDLEQ